MKRFVGFLLFGLTFGGARADRSLNPGDRIAIACAEDATLCVSRELAPTGAIDLPSLPPLVLAKLSLNEAARRIENALIATGRLEDPHVTLRLLPSRAKVATIRGMVRYPGDVYVTSGTTLQSVLDQAKPLASANTRRVTIHTVEGPVITVDVKARPWRIYPGDEIELLAVAANPVIFLLGAVGKPGAVPFRPGMTVADAIRTAGGLTPHATMTGWTLRHADEDVNLAADAETALAVGDTIEVPLAKERPFVAVSGAVKNPGSAAIGPETRLTELLDLVGGLIKDADTAHIEVKSIGETRPRVYDLKAIRTKRQEDPKLKAGDTVTVAQLRVKGGA